MGPVHFGLDELLASRKQLNRATINFLKIDLDTAIILCDIALGTDEPFKRRRLLAKAQFAGENVQRLMDKVTLDTGDAKTLFGKLDRLRARLHKLGSFLE